MDKPVFTDIALPHNNKVSIRVSPGHFATNHSHVNYFIDMTEIKNQYRPAREAGRELAKEFTNKYEIDSIVCLEGTEMVGAFLAQDLGHHGIHLNSGNDIAVITPQTNSNNQLIFWENLIPKIYNKKILILMSSVSTGKTISRTVECLSYYGANLLGAAAIFSAVKEFRGVEITSLFSINDVPDYKTYLSTECEMCKKGIPVDAIVSATGIQRIR